MTEEGTVERRLAVLDGILAHPATVRSPLRDHINLLRAALPQLEREIGRLEVWAHHLAGVLGDGGRLLAAGNGGSAAQAQHLTAELVGRYRRERGPYSAVALHNDSSTVTALLNDYPAEELFARQVHAHGRRGDILLMLTTSGRSRNLVLAADAAKDCGMVVWALAGPGPNPVSERCDDAICIIADPPTVQEIHQVAVHLLCSAFDAEVIPGR